jgi:muramoyltetrapeptide carboxypeptidase LdcA involved in peptidoglycan recycling
MKEWHKSIVDAMNVLIGGEKQGEIILRGYDKWEKESRKDEEHPLEPYYVTEEKVLHIYQGENIVSKAVMQGRLLGGCMDCLVNLTGTKYDQVAEFSERYKEDGIIWFLESCDLNVFAIRRAIWQMEHAGWFQHVKGFIIGRPLIFGQEMMGLNQYNAVMDLLAKFQVPVIMDADIGHLPPMMPLITGSKAVVVADGNELEIKMECK